MEYDLMTRKSIAIYLHVSEKTIQRMENNGLPVIKIGDLSRYDLSKVIKWIEENKGITKR